MIGRIDRKKRIELAILALHQLQNSEYQLLIVGEETPDSPDSYLSELKELIQEKNWSIKSVFVVSNRKQVHFTVPSMR